MSSGDDRAVLEFGFSEFARRLGLPPGTSVTSIGVVWFDLNYGTKNNTVRIHYQLGPAALEDRLGPAALEDRLRRLAAKWRAQSRHPQRRGRPGEAVLLARHADELIRELIREPEHGAQDDLNAAPRLPREAPAAEQEGSHADYQD